MVPKRPGAITGKRSALLWQVLSRVYDRLGFNVLADDAFKELVLARVVEPTSEAEHDDELRKVGYFKERRVDPKIVVGLLVDRRGFPLEIGCYEGLKAETTTIVQALRPIRQIHVQIAGYDHLAEDPLSPIGRSLLEALDTNPQ